MLRLRQDFLRFPGGKNKALTLSYDDGVTQDERLIELLKKYGVACTFNLNSGLFGDRDWLIQPSIDVSHYKFPAEEIASVYEGFEIAVHTHTHPDLTHLPAPASVYEVTENKAALERIAGHPIRGMAYPFGTWNEELFPLLTACGIDYARTIESTHKFALPENFLAWHPTVHHTEEELDALADAFLALIDHGDPALFYVWGHAYEFDAFDGWARFEDFLQKVSGKEDTWYATNIEICDYVQAAKQLRYAAAADFIENPTATEIFLKIDEENIIIPAGACVEVPYVRKIVYPDKES